MLTSPGSDVQRAFLVKALASADTLASLAQANTAEGFSREGTQVFEWLFGTEQLDFMRPSVQMVLSGVSNNARPVQGEPKGAEDSNADVQIFCTHNRYREGTALADGSRRIFDPAMKMFLKYKFDCTHALAWTIQPPNTDDVSPDIIQMCPWFLDYAMKQSAQFQNEFKPGSIASMVDNLKLDRLATWVNYTPIDLFQLFDKVMVHELSHTRRARSTNDVGGFSGYGWKNCRKLSPKRGDDGPHDNADSIALFASISGLINQGGMVKEDGSFARGAGGATKRSSLIPDNNGEPAPEPALVKKRALQFDALSLKGRSLF